MERLPDSHLVPKDIRRLPERHYRLSADWRAFRQRMAVQPVHGRGRGLALPRHRLPDTPMHREAFQKKFPAFDPFPPPLPDCGKQGGMPTCRPSIAGGRNRAGTNPCLVGSRCPELAGRTNRGKPHRAGYFLLQRPQLRPDSANDGPFAQDRCRKQNHRPRQLCPGRI